MSDRTFRTSPDIAAPFPHMSQRFAAMLGRVLQRADTGAIRIDLPDGRTLKKQASGQGPSAHLAIRDWRALKKLFFGGHNGFAEAYMDGLIDMVSPTDLFHWFLANERALAGGTMGPRVGRFMQRLYHIMRPNSRRGAQRNIAYHYDLGNSFYESWLDDSMTYSSALFERMDAPLEAAQHSKYRTHADWLDLTPGMDVLEIGCGWGGFAEVAVRDYGARHTGITISRAQHDFAKTRLTALGAPEAIRFQDYRDTGGLYDRIASIEMFEAIGERQWPVFFDTIRKRLKPGGMATVQVITIEEDRFKRYRGGADFIQRYIFPGGMLPSPERFEAAAGAAGLVIDRTLTFGRSYAETLRRWRDRFDAAWPRLADLGFDERFRRMWLYYLTYCEAGFDAGSIDVAIYRLRPEPNGHSTA